MAQLIHLRQRIKAIETIKKITHAMRLISMSTHGQLKHRAPFVHEYTQEMKTLFNRVRSVQTKETKINTEKPEQQTRSLAIVIGSQKGLCGTFNMHVFHVLKEHFKRNDTDIVIVGKKGLEYAQKYASSIAQIYTEFSHRNISTLTNTITDLILQKQETYSRIVLVGNVLKTFFLQVPEIHQIFPLPELQEQEIIEDYLWEESKEELLPILLRHYIEAHVYNALFQSLLAEQAARFISMDSSTRNAKNLLETTKLQYNKLRQAMITKELTELSSSF